MPQLELSKQSFKIEPEELECLLSGAVPALFDVNTVSPNVEAKKILPVLSTIPYVPCTKGGIYFSRLLVRSSLILWVFMNKQA